MTNREQQLQRTIERHMQNESRWLQKTLFALGKAKEARDKLADVTDAGLAPLITLEDGTKVPVDTLEDLITQRVDTVMEALGQGVYGLKR